MKRTLSFSLLGVCLLVSTLISGFLFFRTHVNALAATKNVHAATGSCGKWTTVSSPSPSTGVQGNELLSVAAISPNDAWAVGYRTVPNKAGYSISRTLTEHWNGKQWSVIPSVDPTVSTAIFQGVVALSAQNVWAVGFYDMPATRGDGSVRTLVEHWNGKNWSLVASPNPFIVSALVHVSAVSPNDIWASGTVGVYGNTQFFEHWDGKSWRIVALPNGSMVGTSNGLAAIASNNVWSIGGLMTSLNFGNPLVEHWNGHNWSRVTVPQQAGVLHAITVLSANDIWVAGSFAMLHWNGKQWSAVATAATVNAYYGLFSMVASNDNNIMGIGYTETTARPYDRTLVEHWNGKSWNVVSSPNLDVHNELWAATRVPGTSQFWAVGAHGIHYTGGRLGTSNQRTLILAYC